MPRLLADRFAEDSISQFRTVAHIRNEDAWQLASAGRKSAAVYLRGYVAEMVLKAAWFDLIGYPEHRAISHGDLREAVNMAMGDYHISGPGNLHNLSLWAQLLVRHRMKLEKDYETVNFAAEVTTHSESVYERWRETLRYKKNCPYSFEVETVARSTGWLLSNSLLL